MAEKVSIVGSTASTLMSDIGGISTPKSGPPSRVASAEDAGGDIGGTVAVPRNRLYSDYESMRTIVSDEDLAIKNRDTWGNKIEFLMASLSTAVGLGNVWRFPITAYENGGGAFLIPYLIVLVVIGKPLYFVELAAGQFCSRGVLGVWDMLPAFRGVGYADLAISICTVSFYTVILALCVLYLGHSFSPVLPWAACHSASYYREGVPHSIFLKNFTCVKENGIMRGYTVFKVNETSYANRSVSTVELFYRFVATKTSDDLSHGLGPPDLGIAFSLLAVWFVIFLNMMLGTKTSGKGAYFTALFPYLILFILLGIVLSEDGSGEGIRKFFTPDWSKVLEIKVWFEATTQSFFSLGVGTGVITSYGSYNKFRQVPWTDSGIVLVADALTSILAGTIVFGTIGILAAKTGQKFDDTVQGGPGLAFVAYPEAVTYFKGQYLPQIFSVIFFAMMLTLGIGSSSGDMGVITGALYDAFPVLNSKKIYKIGTVGVTCFAFFLIGLVFTTSGGNFMIDFVGYYCSDFIVFVVVTFEMIGRCYIYGFRAFMLDMKYMYSIKHKACNIICDLIEVWGYVVPLALLCVLIYTFVELEPLEVGSFLDRKFDTPAWVPVAGWTMFTLIVGLIPGVAIWTLLTRKSRRWRKKFLASIRPNSQWGPKDATEKSLWIDYRRSLYPTTKLFRMTIGRLVKVRRTPIMLAAMTSPMSLDINSVSTVGDGSSIIAMSAVKRDSRSGEVKPDAAAAAVASE